MMNSLHSSPACRGRMFAPPPGSAASGRPLAQRRAPVARQGAVVVRKAKLPDLELVDVPREASFKVWSHGQPFRTVRWHYHPEYEIHLVTATSGRTYVGDYIGTFAPNNLVMVGPGLPHNWVSEAAPEMATQRHRLVLQFSEAFMAGCLARFPELRAMAPLLSEAAAGVEFETATGAEARPILDALLEAAGPHRIELLFKLFDCLYRARGWRRLSSMDYRLSAEAYASQPINHVLAHISRNLGGELREGELARLGGFTPTAFSRAFRQHTGQTFVRYVNRLRVQRACELLMNTDETVADICFQVGFSNLSNFNRQFLAQKHLPPSQFRRYHRRNAIVASAAEGAAAVVGSS